MLSLLSAAELAMAVADVAPTVSSPDLNGSDPKWLDGFAPHPSSGRALRHEMASLLL